MGSADAKLFGEVVVTLFVIMDPPGTIPLFLSLTAGHTVAARTRTAWQAASTALLVIAVFAVFGEQLLHYLGITLPALQCAGGLLLLLVALELLTGDESEPKAGQGTNVALVPLGTPLLAGPGAIVAVMVFVRRVDTWHGALALAGGVLAVHLVLWLVMRYSVVVIRVIRDSGVLLVTRISGLLLSAIAVQMVANAVRAFITGSS
ncbi:multiple antibiotic resistance protein [Motilibacter rhizosphaerae]|uniref:UPF0056 membrane protein n=1 Tax=Motilibacter rhizosphaerae TaxID=598652 RepID=A0A4Q7NQ37_9ACTN|nr:MarC family protein [Motilibacter rhizosphaerae]RZS87222.1 multiple antibiotic resistance protein [Motilibacter rhizosphaerae]